MHALILALVLAQQPAAAAADSTPPAKKTGSAQDLGEEVITGQAEVKVTDTKIWFPPQIDPFGPVNTLLAPETYVLDDALYHSVDSMTVPNHFIHSSYLRVPVERNF